MNTAPSVIRVNMKAVCNTRARAHQLRHGHNKALLKVLESVWRLSASEILGQRIDAYVNHYKNTTQANASIASALNADTTPDNVVELVNLVRSMSQCTQDEIVTVIKQQSSDRKIYSFNDEAAQRALDFAIELWLFSKPSFSDSFQTLSSANKRVCELCVVSATNRVSTDPSDLIANFTAKSLTRKGGFYLVWTSTLSEHLTFVSKDQLRVFRHAYILRQYQSGAEAEMFPDGFLEETYRTIHLLFPFEDLSTSRRVRKITRTRRVDIEACFDLEKAIGEHADIRIGNFKYYGSRLAEIKRRYDLARPRRLQQWWFDTRRRQEWGALWIAVIAFLLTIFFGIISAITGIMQVWAAFESLNRR